MEVRMVNRQTYRPARSSSRHYEKDSSHHGLMVQWYLITNPWSYSRNNLDSASEDAGGLQAYKSLADLATWLFSWILSLVKRTSQRPCCGWHWNYSIEARPQRYTRVVKTSSRHRARTTRGRRCYTFAVRFVSGHPSVVTTSPASSIGPVDARWPARKLSNSFLGWLTALVLRRHATKLICSATVNTCIRKYTHLL